MYTHASCPAIALPQQVQSLPVLAPDRESVRVLIDTVDSGEQVVKEASSSKCRVSSMIPGFRFRRSGREAASAPTSNRVSPTPGAPQRAPLFPLRLAFRDTGDQIFRDEPGCHVVADAHRELPLLPEHLLESLDLREELNHVRAYFADDPNLVEPGVRPGLAARDEGTEAQVLPT